jgi:hypothetical protein
VDDTDSYAGWLELVYDLRLVGALEGLERQGRDYRHCGKLGSGAFRILPAGARQQNRLSVLFIGPVEGHSGNYNNDRLRGILRLVYEAVAQAGLLMGGIVPAWCGVFYVQRIRPAELIMKNGKIKISTILLLVAALVAAAYFGRGWLLREMTIHQLLNENKQLKTAITNLTTEEQIGYAKVIKQETRDGKVWTTLRFVETARNDKLKKILEKDYTIEGDIVHFDALIVKFGDKMVMDGRERAMYLWRRVYGEDMAPQNGFSIENPGAEPARYADLLAQLPVKQRDLLWSNIWDLANDPEKLKQDGITAIYGNAVYTRLKEGLIYVFKITPTGQLYPEVIPDM